MGKRRDNIQALLNRCDDDIKSNEEEYHQSLHDKQIRSDLQVDIKNYCGNLRSVLDYLAHDIREIHCPGANPKVRFYFPIFQSQKEFESQTKKWYPNLDKVEPALFNYLGSLQPYHNDGRCLGTFNRINNENKHGNLVAQTRMESERVNVSFPGGKVSWSPKNVKFGHGVRIGGVPVDPSTQMPIPHPSQKVEKVIWVDFKFEGEDVSALGLLKDALEKVKSIAVSIERWL